MRLFATHARAAARDDVLDEISDAELIARARDHVASGFDGPFDRWINPHDLGTYVCELRSQGANWTAISQELHRAPRYAVLAWLIEHRLTQRRRCAWCGTGNTMRTGSVRAHRPRVYRSPLADSVPAGVIEVWLDELLEAYRVTAARTACEDQARTLGLFDRDVENDGSGVDLASWQAGLVRGMWYLLTHALVNAPLSLEAIGARLLRMDDTAPARYRLLGIDPYTGSGLGCSPTASAELRRARAYDHALAVVRETAVQCRVDWQFGQQLLGIDPDHDSPDTPGTTDPD
ncbi:hypothetical protein GZH49_02870 [Nocardia terpenica]|uniref:hypothetical protein n=1 Tax=Nocardia terpenica TaxID=455432 RepID=UPI002FE0ED88